MNPVTFLDAGCLAHGTEIGSYYDGESAAETPSGTELAPIAPCIRQMAEQLWIAAP